MTRRTSKGAKTLPAEYFTSAAVFERELERLFQRRWLCAGHLSQLEQPGAYLRFEVGVESVVLVGGKDGQARAFFNVCRHRGTRLCWQDSGQAGGALVCPYHAWSYSFDGELIAAPNMEGAEGFDPADYSLKPVALHVWQGFLFVSLAGRPEPFERALAPLVGKFSSWRLPQLRSEAHKVYDVEANWKLFFQNYSECYHCPVAHPALNRLTPFRDSSNDLEEGPVLGGPMTLEGRAESLTTTGKACAQPIGELRGEELRRVYYYTVFPNLFLSLHPDYVLVHRVEPLACDRTRIHCDWYFESLAGAEAIDPSPAVDFWHATNLQDWELCRQAQLGIMSRAYEPGPYGGLESQSAAFDDEYLRAMAEE